MASKYTKEILENAVNLSTSFSGVLRNLGVRFSGSSFSYIKSLILKHQISTKHFKSSPNIGSPNSTRLSPDEVLVINRSSHYKEKRAKLLRALLEIGMKYECVGCGLGPTWNNSELRLEIDHINGDNRDNRRENLRFLCPNCHSQTETYGYSFADKQKLPRNTPIVPTFCECPVCKTSFVKNGKKKFCCSNCANKFNNNGKFQKTKITWPPPEVILERLKTQSRLSLAKELGISETSVRKYLRKHGVYTPSKYNPHKSS